MWRRTYVCTDVRMYVHTYVRTYIRTDGHTYGRTDVRMDEIWKASCRPAPLGSGKYLGSKVNWACRIKLKYKVQTATGGYVQATGGYVPAKGVSCGGYIEIEAFIWL